VDIVTPAEHAATVERVTVQGERAMTELVWTVANVNWRASLAALLAQAQRATELEDALRRAKMRAIDAYNECDTAPQDYFLRDIENIARVALGETAP